MDVLSPAKVNLFLHVIGKRPDGYHDLDMLVCAVSLYDRITLNFDAGVDSVQCSVSHVPSDESNLAFKALSLFKKEKQTDIGVAIHIEKHIPAGAGLGGGSSNAATVLKGLNTYFDNHFTLDELIRMGMSLGADVPFFIHGGPAMVGGLGEKLEFFEKIKPYKVVILFPGTPLSTAMVYKKLNFGLTKSEKKIKSPLLNKGLVDPVKHLHNDLEEPALSLYGDIERLKDALTIHGAEGVLMSGSGSSVFGLYSDSDSARMACDQLKIYVKDLLGHDRTQVFLADMIL